MSTAAALTCSTDRGVIGEAVATDVVLAECLIEAYVRSVLVRLGVRSASRSGVSSIRRMKSLHQSCA